MSDEARLVTGLVTYLVLRREGTDRLVQQLEVIIGVVRTGVARTKHQRERLSGRVTPGAQWMKSIAALVRRASVLFVGECSDERGVEVDRDVTLRCCGPDDLSCLCHGLSDPTQLERCRGLDGPPGGRDRRDVS